MKRHLRGQPFLLAEMDAKWSGDYLRDELDAHWPELFLYSKTDFYQPSKYLEEKVLKPHIEAGRSVHTHCWDKSGHVAHYPTHKESYEKAVLDFVYDAHFKGLKGE